ncbi:MAG TPA: HAD hydrolase family protein [bacterium]|nr:HAD hydrolase family protein [bacterium]
MKEKIKKIKFFISDIDGVLTDGKVFYLNSDLHRFFNIKDGIAFRLLKIAGIKIALISGRKSIETRKRFTELDVDFYFEGIENKIKVIEESVLAGNSGWEEICYIGDDFQDMAVIEKAGIAMAPADAVEEIKEKANYVCTRKGGEGAFREAAEMILKEQEKWEDTLEKFFSC